MQKAHRDQMCLNMDCHNFLDEKEMSKFLDFQTQKREKIRLEKEKMAQKEREKKFKKCRVCK